MPAVAPLFWAFRCMVGLGLLFHRCCSPRLLRWPARRRLRTHRWFLRLCVASLPLPWIAAELGWFVAEAAASPGPSTACCRPSCRSPSFRASEVLIQLIGFVVFYSALALVELFLMVRTIRRGPRRELPPRHAAAAAALRAAE